MGCFLGCFGASNHNKCKKQRYKIIPRDQKAKIQDILKADESLELSIQEIPSTELPESRDKSEVPLSLKRRKKVTFDTNVTTYEHIQVYDSTESLLERNDKGETFPKSHPDPIPDPCPKEDCVVSSMPGYRYGNCVESDDEFEDFDHHDYDFDDDYDEDHNDESDNEEHYNDDDDDENLVPSIELKRNARDGNGYILSVLNPVENLDQWKALKSKGSTRKPLNFIGKMENSMTPEPDNENQETEVDASLSNWLISSEKITRNNKRFACYNTELES